MRKNILYIGGFELPDKNAAAQRVVGVAKALRELGHNVIFLNSLKACICEGWKEYFGFECYELKREKISSYLTSIDKIVPIIEKRNISAVIAYNYPALALKKLLRYCKKNNIKCYSDATEWYVAQGNPIFRMIKNYDSNLRMKKLNFKMDGVIAISGYLYDYYNGKVNTVKIPPLVDINEEKWSLHTDNTPIIKFVYAGYPSSQKERIDVLVDAIENVSKMAEIKMDVVGITQEQYEEIYKRKYCGNAVIFHGRVSHSEALEFVKNANWSIVIRDNNLVVKAGFPTKIPESIAAGIPVIANRFSNIDEYLDETNSILIDDISELQIAIEKGTFSKMNYKANIKNNIFDYRRYTQELGKLFK